MPFPDLTKEEVALHEAGHIILILASPLRDYIVRAYVFWNGVQWEGRTELADCIPDSVDPKRIYDAAKNVAGPITQLHYSPDSVAPELRALLGNPPSVLQAIRRVVLERLPIKTHWAVDMKSWIALCATKPFSADADTHLEIERSVALHVATPLAKEVVFQIAQQLVARDSLNQKQLWEFPPTV